MSNWRGGGEMTAIGTGLLIIGSLGGGESDIIFQLVLQHYKIICMYIHLGNSMEKGGINLREGNPSTPTL